MAAAQTSLTALDLSTTYKVKFNGDQYHFFNSGEARTAVEVARQMVSRGEVNVRLYKEDSTGMHPMPLNRLPEKSGSQKRREKLTRAVTSIDIPAPVFAKNSGRSRRKSVSKALVTA